MTVEMTPKHVFAASGDGAVNEATPPLRLGPWSYYFIAKLLLFWKDAIGFRPLENLAFAFFLLVPIQSPRWRWVKMVIAVPAAIGLLYRDSWLPPIGRVLSQASLLSHFSLSYLLELLGRFFNVSIVALLVIGWALCRIISIRVRLGVFVMVTLATLAIAANQPGTPSGKTDSNKAEQGSVNPATTAGGEKNLDAKMQNFFTQESQRAVAFPIVEQESLPFDLIFIQVCSLSWDDLHAMGLEDHPLWRRLDIVLSNFNSAATYSGPAAIRFLRGNCGQESHAALYSPASENCYLMDNLQRSGFESRLILNHDGHFDDFLKFVQAQGNLKGSPMSLDGIAIAQHAFDGAPIYDDLAVLSNWLKTRGKNESARMAVYYNTISLHDGNRLTGAESSLRSMESYRVRLRKLLNDLDLFMRNIESSGRRAVVVIVPEHGAAVRGDTMQIAGLREIPSPAITLVPVGIKVIGSEARRSGDGVRIDTPTSFLALSYIIAGMLKTSPFEANGFSPVDYTAGLPATEFVTENGGMAIQRLDGRYYLRPTVGDGWSEYAVSTP